MKRSLWKNSQAIGLVIGCLLLTFGGSHADQDDPELIPLFSALQDSDLDPEDARELEGQIWQHWFSHDDEEVATLLEEGSLHLRSGDLLAAFEKFDQMVQVEPDYAEAWNRRATVNYHLGRYEDSLADIDETLLREPRHFGALYGRGLVYIGLEEWEKAYDAFGEALTVNPHVGHAEVIREAIEAEHLGNPT